MKEPPQIGQPQNYNSDYSSSMDDPMFEKTTVILEKTRPNQGFGIAISGGRDNPHFKTGSTAIVVSDIVGGSPADGLLRVNDEILSVNQIVVENAPHGAAVNALKHAGNQAQIVVKRLRTSPPSPSAPLQKYNPANDVPPPEPVVAPSQPARGSTPKSTPKATPRGTPKGTPKASRKPEQGQPAVNGQDVPSVNVTTETVETYRVTLLKGNTGYGFALGTKIYVRDLAPSGPAKASGQIDIGDLVLEINGQKLDNIRSVNEAIDIVRNASGQVDLLLQRKKVQVVQSGLPAQPIQTVQPIQQVAPQIQEPSKPTPSPRQTPKSEKREPPREVAPRRPQEEVVVAHEAVRVESQAPELQKTWKSPNALNSREVEDGPANVTKDSWDAASPMARYAPVDVSAQPDAIGALGGDRWDKRRMERIREHRRSQGHEGRLISFVKSGSLGVQVAGGNATGIFVAAVRGDSAAAQAGLRQGDHILLANDIDFQDITREEAVLILLALGEEVTMLVEDKKDEFDEVKSQLGDNFFVRVNFEHFDKANPNEMTFSKGEIFNIRDTMYQGLIGAWQAQRVGKNGQLLDHGILPNKSRAEQMAIAQRMEEKIPLNSPFRKSLQRRGSTGGSLRRAKYKFVSQDKLDENSFLIDGLQIPAYERVVLRLADFMRPVIILGPLADLVRLKLLDEMPDRFDVPASTDSFGYKSNTLPRSPANYDKAFGDSIKLSEIRRVIAENKHCLLEVTPEGIEMLMYAQLSPIVILLKTVSKSAVKEMRQLLVKELQRSPTGVININADPLLWKQVRKVYSMSKKLEEIHSHVFTAKINTHIAGASSLSTEWYYKLKEIIFKQQAEAAWMPEEKPEETIMDDMVFRPPNYMGYVSGGESDTEGESVKSESPSLRRRPFEDSQTESPPRTPLAEPPPYRPPLEDQPPVHAEPPPARAETPPVRTETPPVRTETPPVRTETPPAKRGPPRVEEHIEMVQHETRVESARRLDGIATQEAVMVTREETVESLPPEPDGDDSTGYVYGQGPEETQDVPALKDPSVPLPEGMPDRDIERKKPGSVKVYPTEYSARQARQSLKKTEVQRTKTHSESEDYEITLKKQAEALRKLPAEQDPALRDLDERAGVKVSEILQVDGAFEVAPSRPQIPPEPERPRVETPPARPPSEPRLERPPIEEAPMRPPAPRNYIVDVRKNGRGREMVAQSTYIKPGRMEVERVSLQPQVAENVVPTTQEDVEAALDDLMEVAMAPPVPRTSRPPPAREEYPPPPARESRPPPPRDDYPPPPQRESRPPPPRYDYQPSSRESRPPPSRDYPPPPRESRPLRDDYPPPPRNMRPPSPSDYPPPRGESPRFRQDRAPPPVAKKPTARGYRDEEQPPPPPRASRDRPISRDDYRSDRSPKIHRRDEPIRDYDYRDGGRYGEKTDKYASKNEVYDDEPKVIATARGIFDHRGGLLESTETGVSIYIPAGALPEGRKQEVYFKVCQDSKYMPPLDNEGGETLLSPLVMCGPHGLKFKKPIELRLPHKGNANDQMTFSLKSSDSPIAGHPSQWRNVQLGGRDLDASRAYQVTDDTVSVLVDHF